MLQANSISVVPHHRSDFSVDTIYAAGRGLLRSTVCSVAVFPFVMFSKYGEIIIRFHFSLAKTFLPSKRLHLIRFASCWTHFSIVSWRTEQRRHFNIERKARHQHNNRVHNTVDVVTYFFFLHFMKMAMAVCFFLFFFTAAKIHAYSRSNRIKCTTLNTLDSK